MSSVVKQHINQAFPVSNEEYAQLEKKFGSLAHYAAWQLKRKNFKNNFIDDEEDVCQDLIMALMDAASYYKRQVYIVKCINVLHLYVTDSFTKKIIDGLADLWLNKTKHGAGKQKFGPFQEDVLEKLVIKWVPLDDRPDKKAPLIIDANFKVYCKQVMWNRQRNIGKKITRDKSIRASLVSLSEFDYLSSI